MNIGMAEWKEGQITNEDAVEIWRDRGMERVEVRNGEMDEWL